MHETILSIGIDIGTSTTQLVFSRLTIENRASSYTVPRISIVDKEIIYRSNIYFTPLKSSVEIDADKVKTIILSEYDMAGIKPSDLSSGAVIITGETARKSNANQVLSVLSDLAGDFVVATAGPDLESVLAARGAGADTLSKEHRCTVANLDIGGGTTNIAVFEKGILKGASCLDIGGRLIKIENGKISYIYEKTARLAEAHGIEIKIGDVADREKLFKVCMLMADQLAYSINIGNMDEHHKKLYTNDGNKLTDDLHIDAITISGGVADCIIKYEENNCTVNDNEIFKYSDIGMLLGQAISRNSLFKGIKRLKALETIRATVVGAGTHSMDVTGSTIRYDKNELPIKNIPVLKVPKEEEAKLESFKSSIKTQLPIYYVEGKLEYVAIAIDGSYHTSFSQVQELAAAIIESAKEVIESKYPLIIVVEADIGKVLGNALSFMLQQKKQIICIDGIYTNSGDYIDIGEPVANGQVLPVVNKTLVFNS